MEKKKIQLTEEDLKLGPTGLMLKYDLSSRGHAHQVLKKGYFWENYLSVSESFSSAWVEENLKEIERVTKVVLWWKARRRGVLTHRLFFELREDLLQEGVLYVITRAGEIQSGKKALSSIAEAGINIAINKYFYFGDGAHTTQLPDWADNKISSDEVKDEASIDEIFLQVKDEIISSFGEKFWQEIWEWATSRSQKLPEEIILSLKVLAL